FIRSLKIIFGLLQLGRCILRSSGKVREVHSLSSAEQRHRCFLVIFICNVRYSCISEVVTRVADVLHIYCCYLTVPRTLWRKIFQDYHPAWNFHQEMWLSSDYQGEGL